MKKHADKPIFEMILDSSGEYPGFVNATPSQVEGSQNWDLDHQEGQLAVDVVETKKELVIISTMAGSDTGKIEVYIHNDLLTIRGRRNLPIDSTTIVNRFHEECFWGSFSRSVVLPLEVKADLARADYKNGVLTVIVPKQKTDTKIPVKIVEE